MYAEVVSPIPCAQAARTGWGSARVVFFSQRQIGGFFFAAPHWWVFVSRQREIFQTGR